MDIAEIKRRMVERGLKQRDLAEHLGLDAVKVSLLLNGKRQIKAPEMDRIRELLGDPGAPLGAVPIIGLVAAGNWREAVQRSIAAMPRPDPSIPSRAFALNVDGDSMDLIAEDGATVIVDPDDKALFPRRYYVVLNGDGEATFKQFKADPARLVPCSSNPRHHELMLGEGEPFEVVGRVIWRANRM